MENIICIYLYLTLLRVWNLLKSIGILFMELNTIIDMSIYIAEMLNFSIVKFDLDFLKNRNLFTYFEYHN